MLIFKIINFAKKNDKIKAIIIENIHRLIKHMQIYICKSISIVIR